MLKFAQNTNALKVTKSELTMTSSKKKLFKMKK